MIGLFDVNALVALFDPDHIHHVLGHRQLTDVYLLMLAVAHGGRLLTFDRTIRRRSVPEATPDHLVVLSEEDRTPTEA